MCIRDRPLGTSIAAGCALVLRGEIHINGLLGERKIEGFYLDVGRIVGNFHFFIVPMGTYEVNISNWRWANFFVFWVGVEEIGQRNVTYRTYVTLQCGCSVPACG